MSTNGGGPTAPGAAADGPASPSPRLRRDAEANRQQILEAAGRLMAERGLGTPLEDIAGAAGVGIGTLYRRFPTRDDLVRALFEERVSRYLGDLETALAMPDAWDALVHALRQASAHQIADRALNELIHSDPGEGVIRDLLEKVGILVEQLAERAKRTGRLRADFSAADLPLLQQMLVAVGTATTPLSPTAWERYFTIVVDGLAASRAAPSAPIEPALTMGQLETLHSMQPAVRQRRHQAK